MGNVEVAYRALLPGAHQIRWAPAFTHVTSRQVYWNERKRWHKKRVQLP